MSPASIDPEEPEVAEQRVLFTGLRWSDWVRLTEAKGERRFPKLAYLDGVMELMSPSRHHERIKSYLGALIETWCLERGVDVVPLGSWTLEARAADAGIEPDECYQLGEIERERPDVAIEVVWTSGSLDKLAIYRRFAVPEVWFWRRGIIELHVLGDEGYSRTDRSGAFPGIDLPLLVDLTVEPTVSAAQRRLLATLRVS